MSEADQAEHPEWLRKQLEEAAAPGWSFEMLSAHVVKISHGNNSREWCLARSARTTHYSSCSGTIHHGVRSAASEWGLPYPYDQPTADTPPKFKVGDRVRIKNIYAGAVGTITEIRAGQPWPFWAKHDADLQPTPLRASEIQHVDANRNCVPECSDCGGDSVRAADDAEGGYYPTCGDCCDCTSRSPSPCPKCGACDEDEHGEVHHGGVDDRVGETNGLGLPTMPKPVYGLPPPVAIDTRAALGAANERLGGKRPTEQTYDDFVRERANRKPPPPDVRVGDLVQYSSRRGIVIRLPQFSKAATVRLATADVRAWPLAELELVKRREEL